MGVRSRKQRLALYLGLIAVPGVVLLVLGLHSAWRQSEAVAALRRANLRLEAERVSTELDVRIDQAVAALLRDTAFLRLRRAAIAKPLHGDAALAAAKELAARQPWLPHPFVFTDGELRWPQLRPEWASTPVQNAATDPPSPAYVTLLRRAEETELRAQRPAAAAAMYDQLSRLPLHRPMRAQAVSRAARTYHRAGNAAAAVERWRRLFQEFGDLKDGYGQPHAVLGALAIAESSTDAASRALLEQVYLALLDGRWAVSLEQVEYFAAALEDRLGRPAASRHRTPFLSSLDLARALDEAFPRAAGLTPGQTHVTTAGRDGRFVVHYAALDGGREIAGVAVDAARLQHEIAAGSSAGAGGRARLVAPNAARVSNTARAPLAALPGWQLELRREGAGASDARAVMLFGGTTVLVLGAIGVGLALLIGDVRREAKLTQLRSSFVNAVSHDLKTPITVVRLYAESLADGQEPPADERRRFYDIILRETDRLARMVDRVLKFSMTESGARQYRMAPTSVLDVVAACLEQNGPYLKRHGFAVTVSFDEPVPVVSIDADAVSDAVTNLLENAVKYSGDARTIAVSAFGRGDAAVIEVQDHGVGVPEAEQARIFEAFYRSERHDRKGGHGLGLSLVQRVMSAHRGAVEVDSIEGRGSRFRLVFPRSAEHGRAGAV